MRGNQPAAVTVARRMLAIAFVSLVVFAAVPSANAQTPPLWDNGVQPKNVNNVSSANCGYPGCAIKPVAWPAENQWIGYSWGTTYPDTTLADKHQIKDQRNQDPSNGGTTPQNYVNVSSNCTDQSLPSISYFYNPVSGTIYFRWRVEQIANSYATGPTAGTYSSSDPWKSALWTVFFDTDGDGFRDFAAHLDGSSGSPGAPVDVLRSIWSNTLTNSIDYVTGGTNIYSLFTNPTAFVDANGQIVQFNGSAVKSTVQWPNGSSETIWDYGTTRAINVSTGSCSEYYVDYQIPVAMLNAAGVNGETFGANTPFQFLFATANSLNNPFQKDIVWEGSFVCDATSPGPFGDALTLNLGIIPQPISTSITAGAPSSCSVPVTAQIMSALTVNNCQSISQLVTAQFKYWYDTNANGLADDAGSSWVNIGDPTVPVGTTVTANWSLTNLIQGQYLIALEIQDNRGHLTRTWEPNAGVLNQPMVNMGTYGIYSNAPAAGTTAQTLGVNYQKVTIGGTCGMPPPSIVKTANAAQVAADGAIQYTLSVTNPSGTAITVSKITDTLPPGFKYQSSPAESGTLGTPTSTPLNDAVNTVSWDMPNSPIGAGQTRTFIFNVKAGQSGGTFFNTATMTTNVGTLTGTHTAGISVKTANLTVTKMVALTSAPAVPVTLVNRGDAITYTMTVTNNSQTNVTGGVVSDTIPTGFTFVSATSTYVPPGASCSPTGTNCALPGDVPSRTVRWTGLTINVGQSYTFTINAIANQAGSAINTVNVTSIDAPAASATANLFVSGPVMAISKISNKTSLTPASTISYTIYYANVGNQPATLTNLTDQVPTGFTLSSSSPVGCTQAGTTVTCPIATLTSPLAAGSTAAITLNFNVAATAPNPSQNIATINASNANSASTNYSVTIDSATCATSTYYFRNTRGAVGNGTNGYAVGFVTMTSAGTGYTSAPAVTIAAPPCTINGTTCVQATGVAVGNATGGVAGVNITNGGSGYTSAPLVSMAGGGGTGAAGTAVLTNATPGQYLANTTTGTAGTQVSGTVTTEKELIRFYQDPPDSSTAYIVSAATVKTGWDLIAGNKLAYSVVLAKYNPTTNLQTTIATVTETGTSANTNFTATQVFTVPANTVLNAGERLVWMIRAKDFNNNANTTVNFNFNGDGAFNGGAYQSYGTACLIPVRMSLTKEANKLIVSGTGDTLDYTVKFANPSTQPIAGVVVTDPLPPGTTFNSIVSTSVGSAVHSAGTVTWTIGNTLAGATGTMVVRVNVLSSITGASFTNTATLTNNVTGPVTASTTTMIGRPNVLISKIANGSNFVPGDVFSYRLSVINAGNGAATGVTVTDTLPSQLTPVTYTTSATSVAVINITNGGSGYVTAPAVSFSSGTAAATAVISGGSVVRINITNGGSGYVSAPNVTIAPPPAGVTATATSTLAGPLTNASNIGNALTFNIGNLAVGGATNLNVTVQVAATGIPAGQTTIPNTATVVDSYDTSQRTSTATVTVTATPAISLGMTATPSALRVVFVNVTAGGSGYTSAPNVTIAAPPCVINGTTCVQATAEASINSLGQITGITILNMGAGYTGPLPAVNVSGGGGSGGTFVPTVGPGPGDTVTYALTVTSTGTADATGVVITGTIPGNTAYTSGGTFGGTNVTQTVGTMIPGATSTLTYVVTINSTLPYLYVAPWGVTALTANGSATSTNTAAPTPVSATTNTGASPRYAISKTPDNGALPYPAARLSGSAAATTTVSVNSAALLSVGDYVEINGTIARITAKSGTTLTLSTAVTAPINTYVTLAERYTITFSNIGIAAGANVVVTDTLPAGLLYAGVPVGSTAPNTAPAIGSSGPVTWNVGVLTSGASDSFELLAYPNAAGTYTDTATVRDGTGQNTRNATDTAQTTFGALNPVKATNTPQVTNGSPTNVAHYVITIQNPLPSTTATSVVVTDNLATGFTYKAGSTKINGGAVSDASVGNPTGSSPVWSGTSLNIAPNGSLILEFDAEVASNVATGSYENEVLVSSSVPSLIFDYLATPAENVYVCEQPPPIVAPAACASSTGNVASTTADVNATYSWSITNGTITNFSTGTVNKVVLGAGGSGYNSGATISFSGGGGAGATANATVVGGVITAITIVNPGSGYTSVPGVVITPVGGGSGANAVAVLGTGIIYTAGASGTVGLSVNIVEGSCSVTSNATVTINPSPSVTTNINSVNACPGTNVTFSPVISGATTFQWQVNSGAGFVTLTNSPGGCATNCVSGATTTSLTITNVQAGINGFIYRLVATNGSGCSTITNAATVNVTCALDLEVTTNSDSPDPVFAGKNITYTQSIKNLSTSLATGTITFSQPVPAGTTYVSMTPPAGWSCNLASGVVTCTTNNDLAANTSSGNFTLVLTVDPTTADGTQITETATVSIGAPDTDSVASNNSKSATTTVRRQVDVQIVKDDNAIASGWRHFLYPGDPPTPQPMNWTLTVGNGGPTAATAVKITDPLPSGFVYGSYSDPSGTFSGGCTYTSGTATLECTGGNLPPSVVVNLSGGGGTGATAIATLNGSGGVTAINVINGGTNYTSAPTVTISGAGTGATATATVASGAVTGFVVNTAGSGYVAAPTIVISGTVTAVQTQITNVATPTFNETDSLPSNNVGRDTVSVLAPTFVEMFSMEAFQTKNAVTITWETSMESNNLGFHVYRETLGGEKEKLNNSIITGSAFFDGAVEEETQRSYRFVDRKAKDVAYPTYWIEDVDLDGTTTMHGPVTPVPSSEDDTNTTSPTEPDRTLGSVGGIFTTAAGMGVTASVPTGSAAARQAEQWSLAGTPNGKIVVTRPGWYRVSKSQLLAAGFDPGTKPRSIALFTDGLEVPMIVNDGGDDLFDDADTIEFFGHGFDSPTAGSRVYYVNTVKGTKVRIRKQNGGGRGAAPAASYPYTFDRTERNIFVAALTNNGERENFFGPVVSTAPMSQYATVAGLDTAGNAAKLEVVMQGMRENQNHIVTVQVNGNEVGPLTFKDMNRYVTTLTVPLGYLVQGENKITFRATNTDNDVSVIESFRLTYPHLYRAESNALMFTAAGSTSVVVSGFTTGEVRAVDVTNAAEPVMVPVTAEAAADGTFNVSLLTESGASRTIFVFGEDRVQPAAQIVFNEPSTWNAPANAADLVIISNKAFLTQANELKAARIAQGYKTVVVDVQNVYDEFSYGAHSPQAIRDFLKRTSTWTTAPKYAILVGDASFDPRNYLGIGSYDFVPTKLVITQNMKTASDDWFADFNDTGLPSIAIGRIPARTEAEATAMIGKLVRRPATPPAETWANTVSIVNDVAQTAPFVKAAGELAAQIPAPFTVDRIDFTGKSGTAARTLVVNAFNSGRLLFEYLGHGSTEIWGRSVFSSTNATALTNGDKLPFVMTMNCLNGYFHDLYTVSLAEALLKNSKGGAIGAWASSSLTSPDQQLLVTKEFNRLMFGPASITVGDAVLAAKKATNDRDVRKSWVLFGDPTLRLK